MDNCGRAGGDLVDDNYLKYDLSKLSLGDKFAIEMSVRGSALKRGLGGYKLFNFNL